MASDDYATRFNELASRYMSENVRIWQRYGDLMRRLSQGQVRGQDIPQHLGEFARTDGAEFLGNLLQLNLNYYSTLLALGVDLTNRAYEKVLPAASPAASAESATPEGAGSPVRFELVFAGRQGEAPSSSFVVANKKAESTEVSFELTEFVSEDGTRRFRAPVEFVPDHFPLAPQEERIVECRVPIAAAFEPGSRYMALARATGFSGLDVALIVTPSGGADESAAAASTTSPAETPVMASVTKRMAAEEDVRPTAQSKAKAARRAKSTKLKSARRHGSSRRPRAK